MVPINTESEMNDMSVMNVSFECLKGRISFNLDGSHPGIAKGRLKLVASSRDPAAGCQRPFLQTSYTARERWYQSAMYSDLFG
jgi:hypothetical protein